MIYFGCFTILSAILDCRISLLRRDNTHITVCQGRSRHINDHYHRDPFALVMIHDHNGAPNQQYLPESSSSIQWTCKHITYSATRNSQSCSFG
jgi:hypothetical protein